VEIRRQPEDRRGRAGPATRAGRRVLIPRTWVLLILACAPAAAANRWATQQGGKLVGWGAIGNAEQGFAVALSADGNTALVGGPFDNNFAGAAWVFTRSKGAWTQQGGKLVGWGAIGNAEQGFAVALSADGDTAIVGGLNDDNGHGAAWVYSRSKGAWAQQGGKLTGAGEEGEANLGSSVALAADGNTAMLAGPRDGGSGAVWVYTRSGAVWTPQGGKLAGLGAKSVALSADGNTALVGGSGATVLTRSGGVWNRQAGKLSAAGGESAALSADGHTAVVGGFSGDLVALEPCVYTRSGTVWTRQAGSLGGIGGSSVALSADGNTAVVGRLNDTNASGAAWVYARSESVWTQQGAKLVGTFPGGPAYQGASVALSADGNTLLVGGWHDGNGVGAVWVFVHQPGAAKRHFPFHRP